MAFQLEHIENRSNSQATNANTSSIWQKEIVSFGSAFSNKHKEDLYTELSVLLKAGVTLKYALDLITDSQTKKKQKEVIDKINSDIVSGSSLSDALQKQKEFSSYEYHSLKIGEETGTLDAVCAQLGEFYARKNEQKRELISALTYPIIILSTAILVVAFMLAYVVPMFQDIFEQQKVELPAITKIIISWSEFIKTNGWYIVVLILLIPVANTILTRSPQFKKYKHRMVAKIPIIGRFSKTVYLSQFTQAIALLTASRVPVVYSIQLVKDMIDNEPLQRALNKVENQLIKGNSLSKSMSLSKFFEAKMIALTQVAEETNQNEFVFQRLNEQYHSQVKQQSKRLSTLMEPFIILLVGVFVGVILIAMYLPMFKLSTVMS